jgi:hypothetical protein
MTLKHIPKGMSQGNITLNECQPLSTTYELLTIDDLAPIFQYEGHNS